MNHEKFQDVINKVNLFLPTSQQVNVERFKANLDKGIYHIVLELSAGGVLTIVKDVYKPKSTNVEELYKLQQVFFASLYDKILELGLISLIKQHDRV